ncbi:Iron permease [Mycena sanguinolenta]|uniref:Iron permease n=1 Tax=Mycena sanguinolenta TaxID=230812 RepID=A0A8H6Z7D3_9AGAR|nr:Iron permease [Mycena sanguinolenta]
MALSTRPSQTLDAESKRGWKFWLIFISLCASVFLSALDLSSIGTALPVIVHDLHGEDSFAWVSAVYTLTCTAILPLSGQLANIFGRRAILLIALLLFALGSVICATANTMNILIGGRAIQGMGSGGIQSLVAIIIADMVTLQERGLFISLTGARILQYRNSRWTVHRWCILAKGDMEMALLGNLVIMGSTVSCVLALTWAGISFPWNSVQVLAPLICGIFGLFWGTCIRSVVCDKSMCATHDNVK